LGADPGALILRSDVRRKALMGVAPTDRLGPEGYSEDVTRTIYNGICRDAERLLSAGHSVILDAVYAHPQERADVEALARRLDVPFTGIWLRAATHVRKVRVNRRVNDASDADAKVVATQSAYDLGPMKWIQLDSDESPSNTTDKIRAAIKF
jgi:predicted kinase